jgi:glucokinase
MDSLALGIDLGGTNLRMGVVDRSGNMLDFAARPIDATWPGDRVVRAIVDLAESLPHAAQTDRVGIALASIILPGGQIEAESSNIPGLHRFPLVERIKKAFHRPVYLENDAILALLGEARFGAGRGVSDILLLTLGTGIGGALLLDGRLRKGPHSLGCEIGMLPFPDPTMDRLTPIEKLASPKSIARRLGNVKGRLYDPAVAGDPDTQQAVHAMHHYLGWLICMMHLTNDLQLVLLSGGLASVGQPLLDGVRQAFDEICPRDVRFDLRIELGSLPQHAAGVIGAASLCFE